MKFIVNLVLVLGVSACFFGCTETFSFSPVKNETPPPEQQAESVTDQTGAQTEAAKPAPKPVTAVYYDFEDVLIPLELSIVQNRTMVVSTPGFTSGILVLKGRVERRSLSNFFNNNMQKDNWTVVSRIKSPSNSILVFEKASKCAVITIRNEQFNTWVEIGVAARMNPGDLPVDEDGMTQSDLVQ